MEDLDYSNYSKEMDFKKLDDEELISLATWNKEQITEDQFRIVTKVLVSRGHNLSEFEQLKVNGSRVEISKIIGPALLFIYGVFRYFSSGGAIIYLLLAIGWMVVIFYSGKKNKK